MMPSSRQGEPARRNALFASVLAAALVVAAGCGGRHVGVGDGDGDADGVDAAPDAPADGDGDGDVDLEADADEPSDADADEAGPLDADEVDPDADRDPTDTTWLLETGDVGAPSEIVAIEPFPGGGLVVAGDLGYQPWIARMNARGHVVWSVEIPYSGSMVDLSVAPDGRIYITAWLSVIALHPADGSVIWERSLPSDALVRGLDDGTVILLVGNDVARYSPDDGVSWSWQLPRPLHGRGKALAVTEDGAVIVALRGDAVVALDLDGALLWARQWEEEGTRGPGGVWSAAPTEDGGVVLAGVLAGMWAGRIDRDGVLEWELNVGGSNWPGGIDEACYPWCDVHEAFDVAVGPTGETMVVGYSSASNEIIGASPYPGMLAVWVDRDGSVLRARALAEAEPTDDTRATAAAATPDGGWLLGGHFSSRRLVIASLDADGSVGRPCDRIAAMSVDPLVFESSLVPLDVSLEPSTLEIEVTDRLSFDDAIAPFEHVCW